MSHSRNHFRSSNQIRELSERLEDKHRSTPRVSRISHKTGALLGRSSKQSLADKYNGVSLRDILDMADRLSVFLDRTRDILTAHKELRVVNRVHSQPPGKSTTSVLRNIMDRNPSSSATSVTYYDMTGGTYTSDPADRLYEEYKRYTYQDFYNQNTERLSVSLYSARIQEVLKGMQDNFHSDSIPFLFLRTSSKSEMVSRTIRDLMALWFDAKHESAGPGIRDQPILRVTDSGKMDTYSGKQLDKKHVPVYDNPFLPIPSDLRGTIGVYRDGEHRHSSNHAELFSAGSSIWETHPLISSGRSALPVRSRTSLLSSLVYAVLSAFNSPRVFQEEEDTGLRNSQVGSDFDGDASFRPVIRRYSSTRRGSLIRISREMEQVGNILQNIVDTVLLSIISTPCSSYAIRVNINETALTEDGVTKVRVTMGFEVTMEYAVAISPHVLPKSALEYADTAVRSLQSTEHGKHIDKIPSKFPLCTHHLFRSGLATSGSAIATRGIRILNRSFSSSIELGTYETPFDNPSEFKADARDLIKNLTADKLDDFKFGLLANIRGSVHEVAREYMDSIGSSILDLYFDDDKKSRMYQNFMSSVELYANKHFEGTPYESVNEYSENLDKRVERCFSNIESFREAYLEHLNRGVYMPDIINLSGGSPSRIESSFSRRGNHLVVVSDTGELHYYKVELSLGSGPTACHRLTKFPKVFADGYIVAPDKSIYKVTASDLVRGRVLRSSEITLEQALGDINNEARRSDTVSEPVAAPDSEQRGTVQASSDYQECGFDEDIGDEEREFIDMALQNQILALRG